jgi:hypothetical protein
VHVDGAFMHGHLFWLDEIIIVDPRKRLAILFGNATMNSEKEIRVSS